MTHPYTQPSTTISNPTYNNSPTSVWEPIQPFDGFDHKDTPEEYLQHIEARVTFSLGLQPTNSHEYNFRHARRMAFIQCSLTGTALSWYIRLNDTNKTGLFLYKLLGNNFLLKRTLILHKLKPKLLSEKIMKR